MLLSVVDVAAGRLAVAAGPVVVVAAAAGPVVAVLVVEPAVVPVADVVEGFELVA